tara:strand:+ start:370 stop:1917 length:1548 start_codon:yes stop_codon:yes gene_type:complete
MDKEKHFQNLQKNFFKKKFNEVLENSKKLLKKFPQEIFLLNICGLSLYFLNKNYEAILHFNKAIEIDNNNYYIKINLANALTNTGEYEEAEKNYIEALNNQPNNPTFLSYYAIFKSHLLKNKKAIELFDKATKYSPKDVNLLGNLAAAYQKIGDFKNSKKICQKIININPKYIKAHIILNNFTNYKDNEKHFKELLKLNNIQELNFQDKASINFSIGKAHEDKKNYDEAFKYFKQANLFIKKSINYNAKNNIKLFENIKSTFKTINNKKIKNINNKKVIFICGLPRSGTTLVEQILSSHSKVSAAGELGYLDKIIYDNFIKDNKINRVKIINEFDSSNNILSKKYYKFLKSYNFKNKYITDKTPLNFKWIGFIKNFLPDTKIIICNRNLDDVFVSIFKNNFTSNEMKWAFDEENIVKFIALYKDLINFYFNLYEKDLYKINYENLINNTEVEIKNMLKFCDLEWEKNCLEPHKNFSSSISTASIYQARKPIYKSSINTSNIYNKYLNKYFKLNIN